MAELLQSCHVISQKPMNLAMSAGVGPVDVVLEILGYRSGASLHTALLKLVQKSELARGCAATPRCQRIVVL